MSGVQDGGQHATPQTIEAIQAENDRLKRDNFELRGHVAVLSTALRNCLEGGPVLGNGMLSRDRITDEQ